MTRVRVPVAAVSLPHVVCDVGGAFAEGQVYVALSRATSMQGLQIVNFDPRRIKVCYPAKYFHEHASEASAKGSAAPMEALWSRSHFWFLPLLNTANANPRWLELYESKINAWQFERWLKTYPVPGNLVSPSMAAAVAAAASRDTASRES